MCILVASTVMSPWESVAAVSCSCLTDAMPQRIIGQARFILKILLDKIIDQDIIVHWLQVVPEVTLCAWTHILSSSPRASSHLRCTPMELLPASQYVFINGVRAWTYSTTHVISPWITSESLRLPSKVNRLLTGSPIAMRSLYIPVVINDPPPSLVNQYHMSTLSAVRAPVSSYGPV